MALRTFVKINGITNLTDARYCSGMYVDLLGFTFEEGADRLVSTTTFKEISGWVSGVDFVAEFEWASCEEIRKILENCSEVKWLEHKRIETLLAFREKELGLIYKCTLGELAELSQHVLEELENSEIIIHVSGLKSSLTDEDENLLKELGLQQKNHSRSSLKFIKYRSDYKRHKSFWNCPLYKFDAADDMQFVVLVGCRFIKKKKTNKRCIPQQY